MMVLNELKSSLVGEIWIGIGTNFMVITHPSWNQWQKQSLPYSLSLSSSPITFSNLSSANNNSSAPLCILPSWFHPGISNNIVLHHQHLTGPEAGQPSCWFVQDLQDFSKLILVSLWSQKKVSTLSIRQAGSCSNQSCLLLDLPDVRDWGSWIASPWGRGWRRSLNLSMSQKSTCQETLHQ